MGQRVIIAILIAGSGCVTPAPGQSVPSSIDVELRKAGTKKWTSIGPYGGEIWALSVDPHNPGALYSATGGGVAFRSLDGGVTWAKSGGPNGLLVFDPQDANTIYSIGSVYFGFTCGGITKSTDAGKSWSPANFGLPASGMCVEVLALGVDPHNPSTLYAGTSWGVYKSTDGGANWISSNAGLPKGSPDPVSHPDGQYPGTFLLAIDPQNSSTIYAVVNHFEAPGELLFKSTDGGETWNPAGSGLPQSHIVLAIDPQNPSTLYAGTAYGIFKSTDGAGAWSPVNAGLPFDTEPSILVYSILIDRHQPDVVYAAIGNLLGGKVFKTSNGGANWSLSSFGLPEASLISSLQADLQVPANLYAATNSGVFKSPDGGKSWAAVNSGLTAILVSDLRVDPRNASTLYAVTTEGLLKTTDGGTSWNSVESGMLFGGGPIAIDPQNTNTVFADGCTAVNSCGIVKSTDGGTKWSSSWNFKDPANQGITAIAIDPRNSNVVYATTRYDDCGLETFHKTVDGGVSWSNSLFKDMGLLASCVFALAVDPHNSGNLYAAFQNGGIYRSTDGGATWSAANSGLSPGSPFYSAIALAIDPRSAHTLYTVSFSGVFKSTDGGTSWNPASTGLPNWSDKYGTAGDPLLFPHLAVDPQNSARVYLSIGIDGAQRVFQSSDGGETWIDSGLAVEGASSAVGGLASSLDISSDGSSTVYAGSLTGIFALTPLPGRPPRRD